MALIIDPRRCGRCKSCEICPSGT